MYAFAFMDGTWRLALYTRNESLFRTILATPGALPLYDGVYRNRDEAERARRQCESMIGHGPRPIVNVRAA